MSAESSLPPPEIFIHRATSAAVLSQNDCTIIAEHPLDILFDHLWESLRKAEQDYRLRSISHDVSVGSLDSGLRKAISRFLNALGPRGCLSPLLKDWKWQCSHWTYKKFWTQFNAAVTMKKTTVCDHALSSAESPMSMVSFINPSKDGLGAAKAIQRWANLSARYRILASRRPRRSGSVIETNGAVRRSLDQTVRNSNSVSSTKQRKNRASQPSACTSPATTILITGY